MKRLLLLAIVVFVLAVLLSLLWRRLVQGQKPLRDEAKPPFPTEGWLPFALSLPAAAAALVALARGLFWPFVGDAVGYALLLAGALALRRGLLEERRPHRARRPLKTLGTGLIGLGAATTAWLGVGHPPAIALAFGLVAVLGCYLTYGFDLPLRRRALADDALGAYAGARLDEAERAITAVHDAMHDIRQPELAERLRRIVALARDILAMLEEDPRDLRRARKFLNIYLDGVQRIVEGYARTHTRIDAPNLDERFRRALITVEEAFREQQRTLLDSDIEDLDVQIEVLTRQLEREGIL